MLITEMTSSAYLLDAIGLTAVEKTPAALERQFSALSGNVSPREATKQLGRDSVSEAVATVEAYFQDLSRNLEFQVNDNSGSKVVSVVDGETGEVIRQFPTEAILATAQYINENYSSPLTGVLVDQEG
jgi:flagellar protein FlaG